jgi:hypothetical protein
MRTLVTGAVDLSLDAEVLGFRAEFDSGVRSPVDRLVDEAAVDRVDKATASPLSRGRAR